MSIESQADRSHAVVIGGSMGGLLAARVLADHYRRVTLIERTLGRQDHQRIPGEAAQGGAS